MNNKIKYNLIVVTGPTATGKTRFAAHLASSVNGEVISADSRQVYRGMDLATGKDFSDYEVGDKIIPYHLVDIVDPGYEYNVFEFQKDFQRVFEEIHSKGKMPVLCGGTGMYIESVLKGYNLIRVPENKDFRKTLQNKNDEELIAMLESYKTPHNITDTEDRDRLIRAIEIAGFYKTNPDQTDSFPRINPIIFGVHFDRKAIRKRITERLEKRLEQGMLREVEELLQKGLTPEQMKFYGLEYKYLTRFVTGEITYDEMYRLLNTAIHQFAKRQMTWFRRMERQGFRINWIDGNLSLERTVKIVLAKIEEGKISQIT